MRDVAYNEECEERLPIVSADAFVKQCAVVVKIGNTLIAFGAVGGQRGSVYFAGYTFARLINVAEMILLLVIIKQFDLFLLPMLQ